MNFSKIYKKVGQSVYSCQYIVAFCTKYKRNIFSIDDIETLENSFTKTAKKYNFIIHKMDISKNGAILTIEIADPDFSPSNAVTKLKKESKDALIAKDASFKSRIPCIWTREEFITTIGTYSEREVNKFIDLQDNYLESINKNK